MERSKHASLGQKPKHPKSVLTERKRAEATRRETLLVEYRNLNRSNRLIDGRFGEGDESLPPEEAHFARLQRQRLREARSSKFALEEPADTVELTHGGRSLGEIEDNELAGGYGGGLDDDLPDNDPDGFGGSDFIKAVHFGGGGEAAALSQKEALEAAIAKHKLARLDRKEQKERERGLVDQLDADFGALKQLIFSSASEATKPYADIQTDEDGYRDYHSLVAAMQSEIKAQPTDRLQSDAELAQAEQKRLRMLEADRMRRSRAESDEPAARRRTDDELHENFESLDGAGLSATDAARLTQSDDGDELLMLSPTKHLRDDGEGEADSKGAVLGESDEDGSELSDSGGELGGNDGDEATASDEDAPRDRAPRARPLAAVDGELPYVIECPTTSTELDAIFALAGPSTTCQKEAMHRVVAGTHVKLHEANREKLGVLASLLLRRLVTVAGASPPCLADTKPVAAALAAIAQQIPLETAAAILKRLAISRSQWLRAKAGGGRRLVPLPPGALALLALCCQMYPLSDYRHAVLTPCALLVGEVLSQPELPRSRPALRRTLFLIGIGMKLIGAERRFMPELHSTTLRIVRAMLLYPGASEDAPTWTAAGSLPDGSEWSGSPSKPQPLSFASLDAKASTDVSDTYATERLVVDEGNALLEIVQSLASMHVQHLASFPELFAPLLAACASDINAGGALLPPGLDTAREATRANLELLISRATAARIPLRMQRSAPVPIRALNPVFDDDFQPDKDMDPDRERAATQKLRRQTKKEHKGAVRELRKDSAFLAAERAREKAERDEYLEGRGKRAIAIMQEQEHLWKEQKKIKRDSAKEL